MFYVVHADTWFQTVPEIWVDKSHKIIRWPYEKKSVTSKWIKKQVPCKPDWRELNYTCLFGPFDNYESSINFEKQCTGYSSQDEVLYEQYKSHEISEKRIRKKNPKYDTDSDRSSEVEDEIPPRKKTKYVKSTLQALPAMSEFVHVNNIHDTDIAFERETNVLVDPINITSPIFIQLTDKDCLDANSKDDENNINTLNIPADIPQTITNITNNMRKEADTIGCTNCCPCIRKMHRKLDMLIHTLQIQYKNENVNISPKKNEFLQMESVEEMKEFENILVNEKEKREQFKTVIKREGGKDIGEHVRRAMRRIMTNTLAIKYSWSGQRNTIRFKDSLISKLIVDSVASAHASANIKKLEDAIQLWLNHASDRKKKAEKRKDHHDKTSEKQYSITGQFITANLPLVNLSQQVIFFCKGNGVVCLDCRGSREIRISATAINTN